VHIATTYATSPHFDENLRRSFNLGLWKLLHPHFRISPDFASQPAYLAFNIFVAELKIGSRIPFSMKPYRLHNDISLLFCETGFSIKRKSESVKRKEK
jgi:hypothetical protein